MVKHRAESNMTDQSHRVFEGIVSIRKVQLMNSRADNLYLKQTYA